MCTHCLDTSAGEPVRRRIIPDQALTMLDALIEEITVDAHGDDEKLWAFRQAFEDHIVVPCDAFVIGEPVSLIEFDYDGNERRGLTARCRLAGGAEHVVAACDVVLPASADGGRYVAAYRKWLGLEPDQLEAAASSRSHRRHKATAIELELEGPIELVVLSVQQTAARCRLLGRDRVITLRATRLWNVVPGEIVVVKSRKQWSYAGHPYLSGEIASTRLDVAVLGLIPLRLEDQGIWNPREEYWGEAGEPIDEWAKPIIARGPRQEFEMEQVLPGADPDDPDSDPITESNELKDAGDPRNAYKILMELCEADLRCLDAHAHLGNFLFDDRPAEAIHHYEVGLRIGELSLGDDFDGLLPWGHLDNRPFLRCMHGFGLCCWRLGRFDKAERVFGRMLWLNPSDNQGARFLIDAVRARGGVEKQPDTR
jgi:tetratricopeptide (TPR) repeat protein